MQCASNIRGFVFISVLCFKSAGRKLSSNLGAVVVILNRG